MDNRDMKSVSTKQLSIANTAKKYPHEALTVLHPKMDEHWLWEASTRVRRNGASGVDGQTAADYEQGKSQRLKDLLRRAKDGSYHAPPVKRVYIPKDGSEKRGIGIPTYEDKILQRAVVMLLEPIYEGMFHDFSFGFRPGKSPHQALQYLRTQCYETDVAYVLDVDLRKYFDTIDHAHLREILQLRVGDGVITRLIHKWLKAGVWEDGQVHLPESGSPQGGVISPLLSNIYLHTVLDDWYVRDIQPHLEGKSFMVRYADDFVMGFANKSDAGSMLDALKERFAAYGLQIHPEKTRLVRFKRPSKFPKAGESKPETFDFLGFTHYWGKSRRGNNVVHRKTSGKRFRRSLKAIKEWGWQNRHLSLKAQQETINRKLSGHYGYYGITGNYRCLSNLRFEVQRHWRRWLGRRTRGGPMNWQRFNGLLVNYPLIPPRIVHSYQSTPSESMV
jgi:group II intron reverse transcriptase/maturase